jgi:inorganic pyrophosphatase
MALDWAKWELLIAERGVHVDRIAGSDHPRYPGWTYPVDYGYIPETVGGDGREVDVFCGTACNGLTAAFLVRHGDVEEVKLLWNASAEEMRAAYDFLAEDMTVEFLQRS